MTVDARPTKYTPLREVIADVAAYFEIPVERLTNVTWRDRRSSDARMVAAWMLCEAFPAERVETISRLLGYRERTGASHAVTYLERRIGTDLRMRADLAALRAVA